MDDTRESSRSIWPVLIGLGILALLILVVLFGWYTRERQARAAREALVRALVEQGRAASAGLPVEITLPPRALGDAYEWEEEQEGALPSVIVRVGRAPLGEPHRGALVTLACETSAGAPDEREALTDTLGVARFSCEAGEQVRGLFVRATRDRPAAWRELSHAVVAGRLFGASVLVGSGAHVTGRVVDARHEPVPGAKVSLACSKLEHFQDEVRAVDRECTSDAAGGFAFDAVGPAYVVWAVGGGGTMSGISAGVVAEEGEITIDDLVLLPPPPGTRGNESDSRWFHGLVQDALGVPVVGARVEILGDIRMESETDLDGHFLLVLRSARIPGLCVDAGARGTAWLAPLDARAGLEEALLVRLEDSRSISGRLNDEGGLAVEGAVIALRGDRELELESGARLTCIGMLGSEQVATDAEGRFAFAKLWPGRFALELRHPDEPDLAMHVETESGGKPLELVWDRPLLSRVVVVGSVRDARSAAAIDDFEVAVLQAAGEPGTLEGRRRAFHAAAGRFRIAALPPGSYHLRVEASGYLAEERDLGELADGEHACEIELVPLRAVELAFEDPEGVPLSAGAVTVRRLDGTEIVPLDPEGSGAVARLVENGRMRTELPAELLELELALPGNARLSYLLDLESTDSVPEIFVVDLDAHESRESASVLVCVARKGATGIETGWVPSLSREQRERLSSAEGLAIFDGDRLELSVRDRHGALVGRGLLERKAGGWRSSFALAHLSAPIVEDEELPILHLELPRKGFRLEARAPALERAEIAVEALLPVDLDSSRALVLRERAR